MNKAVSWSDPGSPAKPVLASVVISPVQPVISLVNLANRSVFWSDHGLLVVVNSLALALTPGSQPLVLEWTSMMKALVVKLTLLSVVSG